MSELVLPPLTARSVLLSLLLGSHPPELPVRILVRAADLFGISDGSARVALSRLNSDGDVVASDGLYRLSSRLLDRQHVQDRAVRPATRPWRGGWELAVVAPGSGAAERSSVAAALGGLRLAEIRPGVWGRPDNLMREWPGDLGSHVWRFVARPDFDQPDPSTLAGRLWDLVDWSRVAEDLIAALRVRTEPAERFLVAAAMVRHLRADPVLPAALLPRRWPGARLRDAYDDYRREVAEMLSREQARAVSDQVAEAAPGRRAGTGSDVTSGREQRARHRAR